MTKKQTNPIRTFYLALVIASMIGSVGLAELVLVLFKPQPVRRIVLANTPAMHVKGDVLPHVLRPGYDGHFRRQEFDTSIRINSRGFRGPEFRDKVEERRLIIIGDSFTFGHGVDNSDAYPAILDSLLTPIEVINGGFAAGSSPDMYLAWLKAYSLEVNASAYLIGFFIGNDIDRHDEMIWTKVDAEGLPVRIENIESNVVDYYLQPRVTPIGYRYPILRESHLFHFAGSVYRKLESMMNPPSRRPSIFDAEYLPETVEAIEKTKRIFVAISKWMEEHGVPFAVVLIPTIQQVTGAACDMPQKEFAHFFQGIEVRYLDLLPEMKRKEESLYYRVDEHWNSRGHNEAAQLIAKWLLKTPLIYEQ